MVMTWTQIDMVETEISQETTWSLADTVNDALISSKEALVTWVLKSTVEATVTLKEEVATWELKSTVEATVISKGEVVTWTLTDTVTASVSSPGAPPPEEGTNWLPIALIGGGVALAAAAFIPKKPKSEPKKSST